MRSSEVASKLDSDRQLSMVICTGPLAAFWRRKVDFTWKHPIGDRCAKATRRRETKRNQESDEANDTNNGAHAEGEVFALLPNRLMGDPTSFW